MLQARSWLPRTEGRLSLSFACRAGRTVLADLHQAGAARVRFPNTGGGPPEAVLINTAGGLTGGDEIELSVALAAGASTTVTTAAAEKIYRAREAEDAAVRVRLTVGEGARLAWLPQATILFDGSRLVRTTEVWLAQGASLLAAEMLVFGRAAMGEEVEQARVRDAWRVRRCGSLVYADAFRLAGAAGPALDRPATLVGDRAMAMLLYAAPDAEGRLEEARALIARPGRCRGGASAWNGVLAVRATAPGGAELQRAVAPLIEALSGRALPRVWGC